MFFPKKNSEPQPQDLATEKEAPRQVVRPRADIHEEADAVVLSIELPGCDDKAVAITTEKGVLTVRATPRINRPSGYQAVWCEREDRVFERSFTLTDSITTDNGSAKVKNGVLTLRLPKAAQARPQRIAVTAA